MKLSLSDLKYQADESHSLELLEEKKRSALLKELKKRIDESSAVDISTYEKWAIQYYKRPDLFARECITWPEGESLTNYQSEILLSIYTKERVAVRGPRGLGKTALASIALLHFALTRDALGVDFKSLLTSGSYNQLRRYFWPEVKKWARRLKWEEIGRSSFTEKVEILSDALQLSHGEAFCISPDQPQLLEGIHADQLLLIFDECKSIPDTLFASAEGAFSGAGKDSSRKAYALAISTPGPPIGVFYRIHHRLEGYTHWHPRHVKLEEALAAGQVTREQVERMAAMYTTSSPIYRQHMLGEFAEDEQGALIPLSWIEAAIDRHESEETDA